MKTVARLAVLSPAKLSVRALASLPPLAEGFSLAWGALGVEAGLLGALGFGLLVLLLVPVGLGLLVAGLVLRLGRLAEPETLEIAIVSESPRAVVDTFWLIAGYSGFLGAGFGLGPGSYELAVNFLANSRAGSARGSYRR